MSERTEKQARIFRKKSLDRISSPDQLDEYLRVANVNVFFLLGAVIILLAAFLVWSVLGVLPSTKKVNGFVKDGIVTCYVQEVGALAPGQTAVLQNGTAATVQTVATEPISQLEATSLYNDYTIYMLELGEWNYAVTLSAPGAEDGFASVTIKTGETKPIDFLKN